jgi:metacaspase-1
MSIDKKALLIGINYIGTESELYGCINDVANVQKFLMEECGYTDITIMTEKSGLRPTKENILKEMEKLVANTAPGSYRFLGYSGHGSHQRDDNVNGDDESDGNDESICPLDYDTSGMILDDVIRKIINKMPSGSYLHAIFDSCHSGTIADLRYKCTNRIENMSISTIELSQDKRYATTPAFVCVLSGCKDAQTSADTVEENQNQGALTYSFLHTWNEIKKSKSPTYKSLIRHLSIFIKSKKYKQIPQLTFGQYSELAKIISI